MKHLSASIIAIFFLVSNSSYAMGLMQPVFPSKAFRYDCTAMLDLLLSGSGEGSPDSEIVSTQKFSLDSDNRGAFGMVSFPADQWVSYKIADSEGASPVPLSSSKVPYPLSGHFAAMSFSGDENDLKVSLRGTMFGVGSSWATADFASMSVSTHLDSDFHGSAFYLEVDCTKAH